MVLAALEQAQAALSQEEIAAAMPQPMDRVTLYRIVQGFVDDGIAHRVVCSDGKMRYALCRHCTAQQHNDQHAHFHCLACNAITCLEQPIAEQTLPSGYHAVSAASLITGYCRKCSRSIAAMSAAIALSTASAAAMQPDSIAADTAMQHILPEIVVKTSASILQSENVMSIEKLNLKNNGIHGGSMAEKLTAIAGVDNLSTGSIGKPVIRGLSGSRIAVFAQGIRIENQQWGAEHGLGIAAGGYERAEVVKGPASLLYGSDALGGAIYFVDEPSAKNGSIEANINSEYSTNTAGSATNASIKTSKNGMHANFFGGYNTRMDYADGNGSIVPNSRCRTANAMTSAGYSSGAFASSIKYSVHSEEYGLIEMDDDDDDADHEHSYNNGRNPMLPKQDLMTHIVSAQGSMTFANSSTLKADAGYVYNKRKEYEHEHEHTQDDGGNDAALDMSLHTISYNARWRSPKQGRRLAVTAGSQGMAQSNVNYGQETLIPNAAAYDIGAFALGDYYYGNGAYCQLGLRVDARHIASAELTKTYHAFNFAAGAYQPLGAGFTTRMSISSGYRAPAMYELLSDGAHHGANRYERGNSMLKTENSYQIDASLHYDALHVQFFVNPFFNYLRNYIYLMPAGAAIDGIPVYDYAQSHALMYGGEAGLHAHPHPWDFLHVECSYGGVFAKDEHGDWLALMPSHKINTMISASFTFRSVLRGVSAYLQHRYSFAQRRTAANEAPTAAYNLLHAGIVLDIGAGRRSVQLTLRVSNVLGAAYYDHLSRYKASGIYNMGRSIDIRLALPIEAAL